ncbi:hydroxymethylpyrimidine/phosphomethylpyrimidine kinase [Gaetbulibacter saemankumensis]|uniref:hydroxymethylpyrimidine/phosphomethylpyrimidine kinase n=1 Tax=Gaetbulibacter saemankumensis TaxID=311208 RepID=UPI0004081FEF|nr:hydroxymethylpyrimidine/phosphomethylpyrimidine kinase [Gaetbulibacter saemankumensis]
MNTHKYILSIAGFDPSSGAGITSDIKTFEAHGLYGLSVCTGITVQNDITFKECIWTNSKVILDQIDTLFQRFEIPVVKIGIVESWKVLLLILKKLHYLNSNIKIILDPIFKSSSGFDFHLKENQKCFDTILKYCYIVTPNYDEIKNLYPDLDIKETIEYISSFTNIYLKGGHRKDKQGWDELYFNRIVMVNMPPFTKTISQKHGSGCVLSSALASNIALNVMIEDACKQAKLYTEQFLNSNKTLLGNHLYQTT